MSDWRLDALCAQVSPEFWFPEKNDSVSGSKAKSVCIRCPVRVKCLQVALENGEEFGIWGGLTALERQALIARGGARVG